MVCVTIGQMIDILQNPRPRFFFNSSLDAEVFKMDYLADFDCVVDGCDILFETLAHLEAAISHLIIIDVFTGETTTLPPETYTMNVKGPGTLIIGDAQIPFTSSNNG